MTHQAAMTPGKGGIWSRYRLPGDDRAINAAPWMDAIARGQLVGTCRCGGYLAPGQPYDVDRVTWYPTRCVGRAPSNEGCGLQPAAHGPRPKPKKTQRNSF